MIEVKYTEIVICRYNSLKVTVSLHKKNNNKHPNTRSIRTTITNKYKIQTVE